MGAQHPGRPRSEGDHGLVPAVTSGANGRERVTEGNVDLHGSRGSGGRSAGCGNRAGQLPDEGTGGFLRLQVHARAHVSAEKPRLVGRLGRSDASQLAGAVGRQEEERQARVGGLEDRGREFGDGGSGGDDDGGQGPGTSQADGSESSAALIQDGARVPAERARFEGVGEGRGARTWAVQDVRDAKGIQGREDGAGGIDGGHRPSLPGARPQMLSHAFEAHAPAGDEVAVDRSAIDELPVRFEAPHRQAATVRNQRLGHVSHQ